MPDTHNIVVEVLRCNERLMQKAEELQNDLNTYLVGRSFDVTWLIPSGIGIVPAGVSQFEIICGPGDIITQHQENELVYGCVVAQGCPRVLGTLGWIRSAYVLAYNEAVQAGLSTLNLAHMIRHYARNRRVGSFRDGPGSDFSTCVTGLMNPNTPPYPGGVIVHEGEEE